jgi:hypothetical protein
MIRRIELIKLIMAFIFTTAVSAEPSRDFYTVIDGQIYYTPILSDCSGCALELVGLYNDENYVQFRTDRISINGFD